tara:strand:- start:556 stop:1128 length:573 start_codon:yes stop_codon:yes gene_type:complete
MEHLSTSKWNIFRNYTADRIANAIVQWEPYWHVYVENVLHPELFTYVRIVWPESGWNPNTKGLNPNRKTRAVWDKYKFNMMEHTDMQRAVYGLDGLDYTHDRKIMASLYEDTTGYAVGNHVDGHVIDIAWQLYVTGKTGTNLNDSEGNLIKVLPFKNNSCWIMRNDSGSFHSCDTVEVESRRSIMLRYLT